MVITAIVFDFDGVLADTERLHLGAFQQVFAARGWSLADDVYFDRYLGCDDEGLVLAYSADEQLALGEEDVEALVSAKTQAFSRHLSSSDILFPGVRDVVRQLARRFSLGIASGALHGEIDAILEVGGLRDLFPVIVGADDVSTGKPSPEPYLLAASKLGVAPRACVAVEDSPA
ncbi:MAG: HAD family phosphatase, partial [Acidobacteriota bacterium]